MSSSCDGGFARHYSLQSGWGASYPETSGYIVPTLIDAANRTGDASHIGRAERCLDWLCSIQFPDGGFQGGTIGSSPVVPVTFNTGQILLGLAAGVAHSGERYLQPMRLAADWLADSMDADGCWRKYPTPFAAPGEKAYETHVGWGLVEAARVTTSAHDRSKWLSAATLNARWAMSKQRSNGWFASNCLTSPDAPLTHTIGYVLRGLVEIAHATDDAEILRSARLTADGICSAMNQETGYLAGRLDADWNARTDWVCLTGSAQIAHSLFLLHAMGADHDRYLQCGMKLLSWVRRSVVFSGDQDIVGGVKGSFPVDGEYGRYEYLNWAAKFLIDACWQEDDIQFAPQTP